MLQDRLSNLTKLSFHNLEASFLDSRDDFKYLAAIVSRKLHLEFLIMIVYDISFVTKLGSFG